MGLKEWCQEFYPRPAADVPESEALDHSIRKWEGLQLDNLLRHDVEVGYRQGLIYSWGRSRQALRINCESCALCHHYDPEGAEDCSRCPLFLARGKVRCDKTRHDEVISPFQAWIVDDDPKPMLAELNYAKDYVDASPQMARASDAYPRPRPGDDN